ncbi:hypothetical protein AYK26_07040 [Euryarchaeota archaeon SM23-78]|nr:MAG: hypothetical protein AYK26_07040 [Euryarchaeota archaeon SM23-78]
MAKWQKVYLHRQTGEATTSRQNTILIDLPEKDYMSQILVKVYKLNPTVSSPLMPIFHFIKKLEVIDGSDILYSLSGPQAQALAYYRGRTNVGPQRMNWSATETYDCFYIRFGRFTGDTKYLVDMAKLANPQLKITYDNTVTTIEGRSYTVKTDYPTVKYTVIVDMLRGTPPGNYVGKFISAREVFTWTYVATGTEYIDIPRTDPIFGIGVRACYINYKTDTMLNRVRLNINNQEWVPFDIYYNEMDMLHREWFQPECQANFREHLIDAQRHDTGLGDIDKEVLLTKRSAPIRAAFVEGSNGGWLRIANWDLGTPTRKVEADQWYVGITGILAQHMAYLPMSVVTDTPEETLDAPSCANILLEVSSSGASTSAQGQVVVDVVRDEGR